jgi:hypothetical protein
MELNISIAILVALLIGTLFGYCASQMQESLAERRAPTR